MRTLTVVAVVFMLALGLVSPSAAKAPADFSCANVTEILQDACEALVALYNSTNGPGWTNHTNWLVTNTPGDWYGLTIALGHVQVLNLANNNLTGSIPPELGNLSSLNVLHLDNNLLNGSLPSELGNLNNLQWLYLRTYPKNN